MEDEDEVTVSDWRSSKEVRVIHWLADSCRRAGLGEGLGAFGILGFIETIWATEGVWITDEAGEIFGCREEVRASESSVAEGGAKITGGMVSVVVSVIKEVQTTVEV